MNQKALKHLLVVGNTEQLVYSGRVRLWVVVGHFNGGIGVFMTGLFRDAAATGSGIQSKCVIANNTAAANGQGMSWTEEFLGMEFTNGMTIHNINANGSLEILYEPV